MKTLIVIALAGAITACNCGSSLKANQVAYRVDQCNMAKLDYNITYNKEGKATEVTCYKPGHPPSKYPKITEVPATYEPLEYVQ